MQNENQFTEEIIWLELGTQSCLPVWKDIIYRNITREGLLRDDWCRYVRKRETACASKTSTGRKVKAICEEHPHSWLPSKTCINHTWHRCGLWWIDSWQDAGDKNKHDKELEWLWQPKWREKSLFLAVLHPQSNFISHPLQLHDMLWSTTCFQQSEGWTRIWQRYKRISSSFFVLIFITICIIQFGFKIISPSKTNFNGSVMSLAYMVIMVIQLSNWTFETVKQVSKNLNSRVEQRIKVEWQLNTDQNMVVAVHHFTVRCI